MLRQTAARLGKEGHVHLWLIHVHCSKKNTQYCKVIHLQTEKKKKGSVTVCRLPELLRMVGDGNLDIDVPEAHRFPRSFDTKIFSKTHNKTKIKDKEFHNAARGKEIPHTQNLHRLSTNSSAEISTVSREWE